MNQRDKTILIKITDYCLEIKDTHDYFKQDKELFTNEKNGFIYRNSIIMPILQIGELSKTLSVEFLNEYTKIPWKMIMRMRDIVEKSALSFLPKVADFFIKSNFPLYLHIPIFL